MDGYSNRQGAASERWERLRKAYQDYDACPTCHTVAGNPCRNMNNSGWLGGNTVRNQPHPDRPKKQQQDAK